MKNSENAAIPASAISMLSGRHRRPSGKDAHARRNPPSNSSSIRIPQVHHFPRQNGVTRLVPTVRTAGAVEDHGYSSEADLENRSPLDSARTCVTLTVFMRVSVVIPAYNEESHLRGCLECITSQTLPRDQFEVILVDNGSTDSTVAIAESFAGKFNLRIASIPKGSISAVRNYGASLGSGEILAFLDADCLAPENWLWNATNPTPEACVWGAHYLIPEDAGWVSRVWFLYQAKSRDGVVSFIPASNTFIHRVDFDRLGGFDESIETSEDVDLCTRASAIGLNIIAMSALAVTHEGGPRTLRGFYRQNRWHGNHVLQVFLRNLPSLQNAHIIAMSLYTFVLFWMTIASTIAAVLWHMWFLPLALLGLLLLPPFILSIYRTAGSRSVGSVTQLWILYTTYLLARASALTHVSYLVKGARRSWRH